MDWRWNYEPSYGLPHAWSAIGNYDPLVLTERVPLSGTLPWQNSLGQALICGQFTVLRRPIRQAINWMPLTKNGRGNTA